ncbi:MAG: SPFH domain-containing protein [Pirellulaceae bacterium]
MLGIRYLKSPPTTYTLQFKNGTVVRKGAGLSFFYFAPSTSLVQINQSSVDVPFVFEDITSDFQDATIQGQLTYRIADAERLAKVMDFSIDGSGRYVTDDPEKLKERLVQIVQVRAHAFAQKHSLESILTRSAELSADLLEGLRQSEITMMLGVEVLALVVLSVKAAPEMSKAMQADAREKLLVKADEAVFARRNIAIELERQIKENELNTERVVEERRSEVRKAQMQADISIENQRTELVEKQTDNQRKLAAVQTEIFQATLDAMKGSDWKTIMAASGGGDARQIMAIAFEQLAQNAERIGRLDISPDLLRSLIDTPSEKRGSKS